MIGAPRGGRNVERGYDFLFWAYNVVWLAIVAYVAFLALRLRKVGRRLDELEKRAGAIPGPARTP